MSAYDVLAPTFDNHRKLPDGVAEAIRAAVLKCAPASTRPRLLDLGAGSGRVGFSFVVAGDDYIGVDLSSAMLREFAAHRGIAPLVTPPLVQADGQQLPFPDATFDVVMLVQVFGGMRNWRKFIDETRRVMRSAGALIIGRTRMPPDGLDAQMKQRLGAILKGLGIAQERANARENVIQWLESNAVRSQTVTAALWTANRTSRGFIERHRSGARFSALSETVKARAMRDLSAWVATTFGSLEVVTAEPHAFDLQVFTFQNGNR